MNNQNRPTAMFHDADPDFVRRAVCYLESEQSPEEFTEFQSELLADAENRTLFVQLCQTRSGLIETLKQAGDTYAVQGDSARKLQSLAGRKSVRKTSAKFNSSPQPVPESDLPRARRRKSFLPKVSSPARRLAAIVLLVVSVAWIITRFNPSTRQIARKPDSPSTRENFLTGLRPVYLQSGFTRLTLDGGVQVLIEGPADYALASGSSVRLKRGKLTAKVPHDAPRFTVVTTEATITDLGTEFGVECDYNFTSTEVFQGRVAIQSHSGNGAQVVLSAGYANNVTSTGQVQQLDAGLGRLVRVGEYDDSIRAKARDAAAAAERYSAYSRDLCKDPTLVAYYTFNNADTAPKKLLNNSSLGADLDGRLDANSFKELPRWTTGRWSGKGALDFHHGDGSRVVIPGKLLNFSNGPDPASPLTVLAWVKFAPTKAQSAYNAILAYGDEYEEQFGVNVYKVGYRIWVRDKPGDIDHIGAECEEPLGPTENWQHVAAVYDPTAHNERIYVDGKLASSAAVKFDTLLRSDGPVVMGSRTNAEGYYGTAVDGLIDELAVFRRALSEGEIQKYFVAGKPN